MNSGNLDNHVNEDNPRNICDFGNEGNHCNQTINVSVSNHGSRCNKGDIASIEKLVTLATSSHGNVSNQSSRRCS